MYESHFGFSGPPFQLNPDPAFYFNSKGHSRAMGYLQYGVMQGEGFIVITGEIGAGKTTLLRTLLEGLDRQKVLAAQIVSTQLESGELLQAIITAFGIPAQGSSKAHLIATLEAFLTALAAQGRHALLIVDEAQNLNERAVEELRMLSNFQLGNHALLQSFLVGQPELRRLLESPQMEQLRQRVIASQHLGPLSADETQGYIEHRLTRVGWQNRPAFAEGAFDHIYAWSGGVPRRINRLANRLLLAAYLEEAEQITPALVEQTALELRTEIGESSYQPLPLPVRPRQESAPRTDSMPDAPPDAAGSAAAQGPVAAVAVPDPVPPSPASPEVTGLPESPPSVEECAIVQPSPVEEAAPTAAAVDGDAADAAGLDAPRSDSADPAQATGEADSVEPAAHDSPPPPGPTVDEVMQRLGEDTEQEGPELPGVVRRERLTTTLHSGEVILCVADTAAAALKLAALARAMAGGDSTPRMVLLNPGDAGRVWPWEQMERLLPALEIGLHLGMPNAGLEQILPALTGRMIRVLDEFRPTAVLALGESDSVLACALLAHKRQIPLVVLEEGSNQRRRPDDLGNRAIIHTMADLLVAVEANGGVLQQLHGGGVPAERCRDVLGRLDADVLAAVWPDVTTPYGVFMRHAMPIYLGPTWSEHAGAGTPYAVVTLTLDPGNLEESLWRANRVAAVDAIPKTLWLLDRRTEVALRQVLLASLDLAEKICLLTTDGPRNAPERSRMDQAQVLCRLMPSLLDQVSVLRGASCLVAEPGQMMAQAAELLEVPSILLEEGQLHLNGDAEHPQSADELNRCVGDFAAIVAGQDLRQNAKYPAGAAGEIASVLKAWLKQTRSGKPALERAVDTASAANQV